MPKTKTTSPARSQGGTTTPKRKTTRGSRSLCSPALSTASGRLTSLIDQFKNKNMESFALSPLNGRSVLNDNTEIEEPRRKSWWKKLDENSQDVMEILEDNKLPVNNPIEELSNIEVLSQEKNNYTLGLPESSDNESIHSIVLPQRRLFTQKENQPQNKYGHLIDNRESLAKLHKTDNTNIDKTVNVGTRELFQNAKRSKPIFPAALLNISPKKTAPDKTRENLLADPKPQVRNIFGSRPANKRKNMFADFIVSESEDEIPDIQPKVFGFQKKLEQRRISSVSRGREASPASSITTDIEMDFGMLLPSSTMVENQLEEMIASTPVKRARLSKLSEAKESEAGTSTSDKTKESNKSASSKNKSKASPEVKVKSLNSSRTTRSMLKNASKLEENVNTSLKQDSKGSKSKSEISPKRNELHSSPSKSDTKEKNTTLDISQKQNKSRTRNSLKAIASEENANKHQKDDTRKLNTIILEKEIEINKSRSNKSSLANKSNLSNKSVQKLQKSAKAVEESVESQTEQYPADDNVDGNQEAAVLQIQESTGEEMVEQEIDEVANKSRENSNEKMENENENEVNVSQENADVNVWEDNQEEVNASQENTEVNESEDKQDEVNVSQENEDEQNKNETANKSQEVENEENQSEEEEEENNEIEKEEDETNESQEVANENQEEEDQANESQEAHESHEVENEENQSEEEEEENKEIEKEEDEANESQELANENQEEEDQANESQEAHESHEVENEENQSEEEEEENKEIEKEEVEANESQEVANEKQDEDDQGNESQVAHESHEVQNEENQSEEEKEEGNGREKDEDEANESQKVANDSHEEENQANESQEVELEVNESQEIEEEDAKESQDIEEEANESQEIEAEVNESQEMDEEAHKSQIVDDDDALEQENDEEMDEDEEEAVNESQDNEVENDDEESHEVESDAEVNESVEDEDDHQLDESDEADEAIASDPDISDENQADEMEIDDDEQESDNADESKQNEHVSLEDRQIEEQNEIEPSEEIVESPNVTHDTTGRHRKKHLNQSPEVILHDKTNQMDSFTAKGRNSSVRKTKSMITNLNIKPSLAPPRDSIGFSDGTTNSSAEGSGWDSHRTTRKTLRQTFGKDFTPRKSLRALVMEKSAKRQTEHMEMQSETAKFPLANSTEMPEYSLPVEDVVESDHEASRITRLAALEQYMQKIKEQNIAKKLKMEAAIRNSFKAPITNSLSLFKVPNKPVPRRPKSAQSKPKKQIKSNTAFGPLPAEVIEDMKYKPPKRFKPTNASWVTKRLYNYLETKLESKYDYRARVRAEKLVETIYFFTKDIHRHNVAPPDAVDVLKHEFARLEIVRTHYEFYEFFHEFMPREVRVKVVPDIVNKIALPRHGVFSDILRGNIIVHE